MNGAPRGRACWTVMLATTGVLGCSSHAERDARNDAGHSNDAGRTSDAPRNDGSRSDARKDGPTDASHRGDGAPFAGCAVGGDGSYVTAPYQKLSEYCLATIADDAIVFAPGVVPYDLNTPLFSDYAIKVRGVWVPPKTKATYDPTLAFTFPKGTILTKSFGFADDLRKPTPVVAWVETRLLIQTGSAWEPYTYTWDAAGQEATLSYAGEIRPTEWVDADGGTVNANYLVPSFNECKECHNLSGVVTPIGPKARELNRTFAYPEGRENELAHWSRINILEGAPAPLDAPLLPVWNDPSTGSEEDRARAYLEANCAHCHNADGFASTTGLFLLASASTPTTYGICKPPVAAGPATGGNAYDIVPGAPDASIMVYRLASTTPEIMMPLLGRSVVDVAGLALIRGWIGRLDGGCR